MLIESQVLELTEIEQVQLDEPGSASGSGLGRIPFGGGLTGGRLMPRTMTEAGTGPDISAG